MARIRTIKPEFFKHLELQMLENEYPCQYIMMVYEGLWTQCDKNGVFICNAMVLKTDILPYINFDMQKTLNILEKDGYFTRFNSGNREYGFIPNFTKYQFPSKNEKNSPAKYPDPPANILEKAHFGSCLSTPQDVPGNHTEHHTEPEGSQDKGSQDKRNPDSSTEPELFQKQAIDLSWLLLNSHRKEYPDYLSGKNDSELEKTIDRWAEDIGKLIRIDKKPPENIRQVILWVKTKGNFWFANIESGKKLRQQYEKLWVQMTSENKARRISADRIPPDKVSQYFTEAGNYLKTEAV